MPVETQAGKHVKALDGVRGLAILMVMCSHAFQSDSEHAGRLVRVVGEVLNYGIFGVDLFFVLSGFLITGILVDSLADEGFFKKFYVRRVLRIFPLYYAVLLGVLALTPVLHLHWGAMGWLLVGYLQNLDPAIGSFSPGAGLSLNHFWSLAVEEQFYLVWPAVVFLVRDRRRLLATTLGVSAVALGLRLGLVAAGVGHLPIHMSTGTRADSLLLGGALALLWREAGGVWGWVERLAPWAAMASGAVVVGMIGVLGPEFGVHSVYGTGARLWIDGGRYTALALGSAGLIAWSLRAGSGAQWMFERGWLRFLGKYSYGIYVLHMVALPLLVHGQRAWLLRMTGSKLVAVAGAGVSTLALAVVAAYGSFHLFEKPFLRMKRFFEYDGRAAGRVVVFEEVLVGAGVGEARLEPVGTLAAK